MNEVKRSFRTLAVLSFAVCFAAVFANGCGPGREEILNRPVDGDRIQMGSALSIYESGDFRKAAEHFQLLWTTAIDPAVKREALHGLACSRLVLANKPEEFDTARELWRQWKYSGGPGCPENDRVLYGPVMEKWFATDYCGELCDQMEEEETPVLTLLCPEVALPVESYYGAYAEATAQNAELRKRLKQRENEIRTLRQQASKMEKAVNALKDQIAAIEEIHQEINEKKKGIRNP
jgi:hypothetical protein